MQGCNPSAELEAGAGSDGLAIRGWLSHSQPLPLKPSFFSQVIFGV